MEKLFKVTSVDGDEIFINPTHVVSISPAIIFGNGQPCTEILTVTKSYKVAQTIEEVSNFFGRV
ncbi:hypothetical protein [Edaphocola flava]|uniref:hypothetical protein n=1 Tax=Edaphocola flava TaxID=2499629 RepID=UPI00100ADA98|nr:hypothetical protein [Edaphocola flava]